MGRMTGTTVLSDYAAGTPQSTVTTTYAYNNQGIRVAETVTTDGGTPVTTSYLFDPMNPTGYAQVLEQSVDGQLVQTNTLGHDVLAEATHDPADTPGSASGAGDPLTLLYDGHGSTRMLLDAAMNLAFKDQGAAGLNDGDRDVLQVFNFDAYGNMLDLSDVVVTIAGNTVTVALASNPTLALTAHLYSGEHTNKNGTQYLRARWYDPSSGRFNRLDPFAGSAMDPVSFNKYLYTHGNPVSGIDPSGMLLALDLIASAAKRL